MPTSPIPFSALGQRLQSTVITRLMRQALENPNLISLAAGFTDTASLPSDLVRLVTDRLLSRPDGQQMLQYGTNAGRPALREAIARRTSAADQTSAAHTEEVFLTNGSQQAIFLALATLCDPGDIIFVEAPTYFVFLENVKAFGIEVRSLPSGGGVDNLRNGFGQALDQLRAEGQIARLKAVYLVSYFANPTSQTLSLEEKMAVAATLRERGLTPALLEDAAYRELGFASASPVPSILAGEIFADFPRLYLGTLTKPFASGLKVGFAICPEESWREKMLALKGHEDFGSAQWNQAILEYVLQEGLLDQHLARIRPLYAAKMDQLDQALRQTGLDTAGWSWERPEGGLYLWLKGPPETQTGMDEPLFNRAVEAGVLYIPGPLCFAPDQPGDRFIRLSFGNTRSDLFPEAARRLASVLAPTV